MLEAYSIEVEVAAGAPIPFNNVSIQKGCTAVLASPTTIQFNKKGVYAVSFNTSADPTTTGDIEVQLSKNAVLQPQAQSSVTAATGDVSALSFSTYVQVTEDNSPCCCTSPTIVQILNTGVGATHTCNVCVSKLC